jgi:arylsulfatase A-like enzyme
MKLPGSAWVAVVSCLAGATATESTEAPQARPNILFLLADDHRPDFVAALGHPRLRTPHLDRLAERGTVFPRATCSYPICVVSRAEILTGQTGWENGIDGWNGSRFRPGVTFWSQTLRDAGYVTCHVGKWHVPGRPSALGFTDTDGLFAGGGGAWWKDDRTDWKGLPVTGYRGWVFQDDAGGRFFPEHGVGLTPETDVRIAEAAVAFLRHRSDRPWFLHVNFTAPHDPLLLAADDPPPASRAAPDLPPNFLPQHPFDHGNLRGRDEQLLPFPRTPESVRDELRAYETVVERLDAQVGRVLQALVETGQTPRTLVIYASDHGLAMGSHGLRGKQNLYEHTVNVPLIVAGPGIPSGKRHPAQVYLRELYPTTCDLAGIAVPESVSARSFAAVLRGEAPAHHEAIFGYFRDTQRMVRTDRHKLIVYPRAGQIQLFDLETDPHERHNLAGTAEWADVQARLQAALDAWRRAHGDPLPVDP